MLLASLQHEEGLIEHVQVREVELEPIDELSSFKTLIWRIIDEILAFQDLAEPLVQVEHDVFLCIGTFEVREDFLSDL